MRLSIAAAAAYKGFMKNPKSILITGASSGIGEALALAYAGPGMFLALSGRHDDRLQGVAGKCRERGADVEAKAVDVTDRDAMRTWIESTDDGHPLDLVIANAGIGGGAGEEATRDIFAVNMAGVLNTMFPVIERMRRRGHGQFGLMSSLSGYIGMPGVPAYSASKAMVKAFGEAMHGRLKHQGIEVSVICPGFVESRLTAQNKFRMPMLMKPDKAARIIMKGLARSKIIIAFPLPIATIFRIFKFLPAGLASRLLSRLPGK